MELFTPENISAYGIGGAVVMLFVSILAKDGLVKFIAFLSKRGELMNKELEIKLKDEEQDDTIERETRQIVNQVAIDTRKQLSEIQSKYIEQGGVVTKQLEQIHELGKLLADCRDVAVPEYRLQINKLLERIEGLETQLIEQQKTIAKQRVDIQIMESIYKDTDK
jgi:BMFP domain-containing protein YqiC